MYVFNSFSFGPVIRTASDFSLSSSAKHKKKMHSFIFCGSKKGRAVDGTLSVQAQICFQLFS